MKADVQYNDFIGSAAADISDYLGSNFGDELDSFSKYFKIDKDRFKIIGISIYGTDSFLISMLCVDNKMSTAEKEHIVKMTIDIKDEKEILNFLFKRLHIVLHSRFDSKYPQLNYDEEVNYNEYHESDSEE